MKGCEESPEKVIFSNVPCARVFFSAFLFTMSNRKSARNFKELICTFLDLHAISAGLGVRVRVELCALSLCRFISVVLSFR